MSRGTPLFVCLVLTALLSSCGSASAGSSSSKGPMHRPAGTFLVLGDSLSTGYQPAGGGDPTCSHLALDAAGHGGWACIFLSQLRTLNHSTTITNLAVNGADTCSFAIGSHCSNLATGYSTPPEKPAPGSQWARALALLHSKPAGVSPISIEIGGNDLLGSLGLAPLAPTRLRLHRILQSIRRAAPRADIIMFDVISPLDSPIPQLVALNQMYRREAKGIKALFVDVAARFSGHSADLVNPGDVHPTDAGQRLMARVIWRAYKAYVHG
jgi:lysophospholipase L1-like esterase